MSAQAKKRGTARRSSSKSKNKIPRPQTAYGYFFRYCKNVNLLPEYELKKLSSVSRDSRVLCNGFVERVLLIDPSKIDIGDSKARKKYIGNDTFDDMSKEVSRKWNETDESTKAIFLDLAKKDSDRYNKARS